MHPVLVLVNIGRRDPFPHLLTGMRRTGHDGDKENGGNQNPIVKIQIFEFHDRDSRREKDSGTGPV
jgi:hypothetical protein